MQRRTLWRLRLLVYLSSSLLPSLISGQTFNAPVASSKFGSGTALDSIQTARMDSDFFFIGSRNEDGSSNESLSASISKLDLKAPGKARSEFEKGYQFLMRKDFSAAILHLSKSIELYPSFVAAHNALGKAYLTQGQNEQAHAEFSSAVKLDDHLPNSFLNLGMSQLALKKNAEAEESLKKASAIAPLDLQMQTALAFGEFQNHDYAAVIATTQQVHTRKHPRAAMIHYYAAAAWEAQNKLPEAQHEMEILLKEDPKSPSADAFRKILEEIKADQVRIAEAKLHPRKVTKVLSSAPVVSGPSSEEIARLAQQVRQDTKEQNQILEAEAQPEAKCSDCETSVAVEPTAALNSPAKLENHNGNTAGGAVLRVTVDEVAIFFAATDHGRSVTDLKASDIDIRDDNKSPEAVLGFRSEAELPLRLGFIIDTSDSVVERISFEQAAASKFLQTVVTNKNDLAFVIGVNSSVLYVQDFTADQTLTSNAVNKLAPGGGTALWDAVAFASEKLANRPETQPVARVLVVISDGEDNSSSTTLKEAIEKAQRGEVAVYTVSTRDTSHENSSALIGDHALKTLSELTGGAAFRPGSVRGLTGSLADLQQVIRGRYLISYKAAEFQRDGRYRTINVKAEKDGRKLKVYARKGYYATAPEPNSPEE